MQQIKSEAELYKHLASMNLDDPVSTVYLPNIGKFEIFFYGDEQEMDKVEAEQERERGVLGSSII